MSLTKFVLTSGYNEKLYYNEFITTKDCYNKLLKF